MLTELMRAVTSDDHGEIRRIAGINPYLLNQQDAWGKPPLIRAMYDSALTNDDDPSTIQVLLALGADPNDLSNPRNLRPRSPLERAALQGLSNVCEALLAAGANLSATGENSVFHAACLGKVNWLVERCARSMPVDVLSDGTTPLQDACFSANEEAARLLMELGANPHHKAPSGSWAGYDVLQYAVIGGSERIVELLLGHGAIATESHLRTMVELEEWWAAPVEEVADIVAMWLGADIPPWVPGAPRRTAARRLADAVAPQVVEKVANEALQAGARMFSELPALVECDMRQANFWIDQVDQGFHESLFWPALKRGNAEVVRAMLSRGVSPGGYDHDFGTVLHTAVRSGSDECVRLLIEAGAPVNLSTYPEGQYLPQTPLMVAVELDNLQIAKTLLEAGADPNVIELDGMLIARSHGDDDDAWDEVEDLHIGADGQEYEIFAVHMARSVEMLTLLKDAGATLYVSEDFVTESLGGMCDSPNAVAVLDMWLDEFDFDPDVEDELRDEAEFWSNSSTEYEGLEDLTTRQLRAELWDATSKGDVPLIEALAEVIDLNMSMPGRDDRYSMPPICRAADRGHFEAVRLLLDLGADATRTGAAEKTALEFAETFEMRQLIRSYGIYC